MRFQKLIWTIISLFFGCAGAYGAPPPCDPTQPLSKDQPYMLFKADMYQRHNEGWYVFVACKNPATGLFDMYGGVCRHGVCDQDAWSRALWDYGTSIGTDAKKASFYASWNAIVAPNDCSAPTTLDAPLCAVYKQARDKKQAELNVAISPPPAPAPTPAPAYTKHVKPNPQAADGSRPVYTWNPATGALTSTTGRATKDQPCKEYVKTSGTTDGYAEYGPDFVAKRVTLCTPN